MASDSLPIPVGGEGVPLSDPPELGRWWFTRHWYGELSLGPSWWLCGMLARVPDSILNAMIRNPAIDSEHMSGRMGWLLITLLTLAFALPVWWMVGVWRSAGRRAKERKARNQFPFWARAAQIMTVINVVLLTLSFLNILEQMN